MSAFDIMRQYSGDLLRGLAVTLQLCAIIWASGILFGSLLGFAAAQWKLVVGIPLKIVSITLSAVPVLVFLFWMHYPLQAMLGVVIDPFVTAATALSILNTCLVADLCRSVIDDFPMQYVLAAKVCGLNAGETTLRIRLPIMLRQILPGLLLIQISMLQASLFASLISVNEIFRVAQRINSLIYRPIPIYTTLAIFFIVVCVPLYGLAYYLRVRFTRDLSER